MHGEKHVGNATYLNIQALFAANSDFYQTNWHSWLDGGNQLLIAGYTWFHLILLLQFIDWGHFFLASCHTSVEWEGGGAGGHWPPNI